GGFCYVRKSKWVYCGLTVALKCLKVDENTFNDFVKELRLLRKVGIHPNINSFYGIVKVSVPGSHRGPKMTRIKFEQIILLPMKSMPISTGA
ncbi:1653_t:CDS:2, partial [Racocetra persica]